MIRVCPERDAVCPHGMECPYAGNRGCKDGWQQKSGVTQAAKAADFAAEEAKHPAFRAAMVRDAQDDNSGLGAAAWIIYGAASTVLAVWIVLLVLL